MADLVMWPFGAPDSLAPVHAATHEVTAKNRLTIFTPAILTTAATLNITIDPELPTGSMLLVKVKATATETLTLGSNIEAPTIVGVAGKTKSQMFVFDGVIFVPAGTVVQID